MAGSPFAQRGENFRQALAKVGQLVLNLGRHGPEVDPANDAVIHHFLEVLDQHLLAHIGNEPTELTGTLRSAGKVIGDERLPLAAKDFKNRLQAALKILLDHHDLRFLTLTK